MRENVLHGGGLENRRTRDFREFGAVAIVSLDTTTGTPILERELIRTALIAQISKLRAMSCYASDPGRARVPSSIPRRVNRYSEGVLAE